MAIAYIQSSSYGFLLHQANVENSDDITYLDIHVAIMAQQIFFNQVVFLYQNKETLFCWNYCAIGIYNKTMFSLSFIN
jgi:hypothetical protein